MELASIWMVGARKDGRQGLKLGKNAKEIITQSSRNAMQFWLVGVRSHGQEIRAECEGER